MEKNQSENENHSGLISKDVKDMVLKELHEEGKFDELKKHWASVKGIEAARTVHALFEVYEKENGVILTREDLAAVLKMLGCHNLLWEIRELCCGIQNQLERAIPGTAPGLVSRGNPLGGSLNSPDVQVPGDISSSDDSSGSDHQQPAPRARRSPRKAKPQTDGIQLTDGSAESPTEPGSSSSSCPSDLDTDSTCAASVELSNELGKVTGGALSSDSDAAVSIGADKERTATDDSMAKDGSAPVATPYMTAHYSHWYDHSDSYSPRPNGCHGPSRHPDDEPCFSFVPSQTQGLELAIAAPTGSQLEPDEDRASSAVSSDREVINGAVRERDAIGLAAVGNSVNLSPIATASRQSPRLDQSGEMCDTGSSQQLMPPVPHDKHETTLRFQPGWAAESPPSCSDDETVSAGATGRGPTQSHVPEPDPIQVVTGQAPSENTDSLPCLEAEFEHLMKENEELESTVVYLSKCLQAKGTDNGILLQQLQQTEQELENSYQLRAQQERIAAEILSQEWDRLALENRVLRADYEQCCQRMSQERDSLAHENRVLRAERQILSQERDRLAHENRVLRADYEQQIQNREDRIEALQQQTERLIGEGRRNQAEMAHLNDTIPALVSNVALAIRQLQAESEKRRRAEALARRQAAREADRLKLAEDEERKAAESSFWNACSLILLCYLFLLWFFNPD